MRLPVYVKHDRHKIVVEPDREVAITKALAMAKPGDFLIVAGKGHEEYLIKGSEHTHFNDQEVITELLGHHYGNLSGNKH